MRREEDEARCAASIVAASVGVLICLHQQHFTLHLGDAHSFVMMTTHRCGLVMMAAVLWMAIECVNVCARSVARAQHRRPGVRV